ncbi:MAG: protein kinase [Acidobacteriota bacterium]
MTVCPSCGASRVDGEPVCRTCGPRGTPSDAPTVLMNGDASATGASASPARRATETASGAAARPASGIHGRFQPGTLLAGRYRIVARVGRGGMGEVYRADDLTLGQPVAMKFLPEALEADPERLAQFHDEVRLARQVAHKNVCRMYDVGEAAGLPFLTMEYVDGEDLASLLRRIGRLPQDKATELARQLCAGLAAAHDRGVLHRDLKPANVMIDGEGQVRITDFGLAAIAGAGGQPLAGTPGYMAPELLTGAPASVQSDIYALGLVLYELFTGKRAFTANTVAELVRQQAEGGLVSPREAVPHLDPAIDRTIMRTLERDPARRPRSALAVAAGLPGGDPLAAALAAGETPSPEMVAAAGARSGVDNTHAVAAAVAVVLLLAVAAATSLQRQTLARASLGKPPAVLVDRAERVLDALGYPSSGMSSRWEFILDFDQLRRSADAPQTSPDPITSRPGVLQFYRRTSPRILAPRNVLRAVTIDDPPLEVSGMTLVTLDTSGRLIGFEAVPPQRDAGPAGATPDWTVLFHLAGLDQKTFSPVAPEWLPRGSADARQAWTGAMPEGPGAVRIEAAAWHGRPIYFQIIAPWTRPARMEEHTASRGAKLLNGLAVAAALGLILAALLVSRANVRAGRGDWQGALRLGAVAVAGQLIAWMFEDTHLGIPTQEVTRLFASVGEALFAGGMLVVMHLAVEPAVRRYWPDGLLGWTRLLQGRFRDARVGRDVLAGLAAGAALQLIIRARDPIQAALGAHYPAASFGNPRYFEGLPYVFGFLSSLMLFQSIFSAMWCIFAIVGLKRLLKRMWVVATVATVLFAFLAARDVFVDAPGLTWVNVTTAFIVVGIIATLAVRMGLLATAACFFASYALSNTPWTFDPGAWYFPESALSFAVVAGLAMFAGYAARTRTSAAGQRSSTW